MPNTIKPRIPPKEGIHTGVPFSEYLLSEAWSSSDLRTLDEENEGCPALLKFNRENPEDADKEHFLLGRCLHAFVLEDRTPWALQPETYTNDKGEVKPWSNNANACRAWKKAQTVDVLTAKQDADVRAWHAAILGNEAAYGLLTQEGYAEVSCVAQDPDTGLWLRTRNDFLPVHAPFIADIKTAVNVSPHGFGKSAADLRYECQAWFYLHVYNLLAAKNDLPPKTDWIHIAVRKTKPHFVRCYWMDESQLRAGERRMRRWMDQLADCLARDEWPEYAGSSEVSPLVYPDWWNRKNELNK